MGLWSPSSWAPGGPEGLWWEGLRACGPRPPGPREGLRACGPRPPGSQAEIQDTVEPVEPVMEPKWSVSSQGRSSPFFSISKADSVECALGTELG